MSLWRRLVRRPGAGDEGQVVVLILGFAVMLGLLVTVVIDASTLFVQRRALVAAADAAALAAAQEVDAAAFYAGEGTEFVPLNRTAAERAAEAVVQDTNAPGLRGLRIARVDLDGDTVEVTAMASVRLPFVNAVTGHEDGVRLTATSAARSPLSD